MVTATPRESLTVIASTVNGGIRELNAKLAEFRSRLFGEGEQSAQPPDGPMPCLDVSLGGAKMGITDALSQIDRILSQI